MGGLDGYEAVNTITGIIHTTPNTVNEYMLRLHATNQSHDDLISIQPTNITLNLYQAQGHKGDKGDKGDPGTTTVTDNSITTRKIAPGAITFPKIDSQLVKQLLPGLGQDGEISGQPSQVATIATSNNGDKLTTWRTLTQPDPLLLIDTTLTQLGTRRTWHKLPTTGTPADTIIDTILNNGKGTLLFYARHTTREAWVHLHDIHAIILQQLAPVADPTTSVDPENDHYILQRVPDNIIAGSVDKEFFLGKATDTTTQQEILTVASIPSGFTIRLQVYYQSPIIGAIPQ